MTMPAVAEPSIPPREAAIAGAVKTVLNAGSGSRAARQVHPAFRRPAWRETRLDIDGATTPDIVGSITDMRAVVADASVDAIWSSHVLEHLFAHEVPLALAEFRRVLKPGGFALISSPDLETVVELVARRGLTHVAYVSSAGPITPLDMLFGHSASIARGRTTMAHNTGFTATSLGELLVAAGFAAVLVKRDHFDLWALALTAEADKAAILGELQASGLDLADDAD